MPNFTGIKISDIDKTAPIFNEISFENETWEALKQVKIVATDNIRIYRWAITQNDGEPNSDEWKVLESVTPSLDITREITENGKYFIWVQDTAGNYLVKDIQVDKVDNKPPQIAYTINKDTLNSGYVTINVTAVDAESGLYDSPFSWDNRIWSQENSTRIVKENGIYKVYAEDNLGNVGELDITVDVFPQEGKSEIGEGNVITSINVPADWTGNTNNSVKITLNKDIDITGWQITLNAYEPAEFVQIEQPTNQGSIENRNNIDNNNSNQTNTSIPNNVIWNNNQNTNNQNQATENTTQQNTTIPRTEPIIINTSLDINTDYYLWVKDSQENIWYQTFKIMKGEITRK